MQPAQHPSLLRLITAKLAVFFVVCSCAVAPLCNTGCATALSPGADPVVVRAEQMTQAALETFDTFLKVEHASREFYRVTMPAAHEFAEYLRANAPKWLESARALTRAYKANRTPENRAGMATAMAVLETSLRQAQEYLVEAERKKGKP